MARLNKTKTKAITGSSWIGYITGFILSVGLTAAAFYIVYRYKHAAAPVFSHKYLMGALMALALTQLFVQLVFFLHIDREGRPYWKLQLAVMAAGVVLILVVGSIWIINNTGYNRTPQQQQNYIRDQNGGGF